MKPAAKLTPAANAEAQLETFIGKFGPEHQTLIREVRNALRRRLRTSSSMTTTISLSLATAPPNARQIALFPLPPGQTGSDVILSWRQSA
jgi:hypothetical protein